MQKIEFYRHNISQKDKQELLNVLDSIFLTTGTTVSLFEKKFAQYLGSSFAVGVMSCTHALELALRYFNIGRGDQVITTPLSFVATANAIEHVGAEPVFVDVRPETGNINEDLIEAAITSKTKAIMPVHMYGQMCDMKKIRAIADKHNLAVIEDCAHCVEGERDGIRPGQLGEIACFSFYATKNLACGEGGALTCNDQEIYDWLLQARLHGLTKGAADRYSKKYQHYDVTMLGMKCNMSNLQAALLLHQLDELEGYLDKRTAIVKRFERGLSGNTHLMMHTTMPNTKHAHHLFTIIVDPAKRDEYMHALQEKGIGVAVNFRPIHLMTYYKEKYDYTPGMFNEAERIGAGTITLPLYIKLTDQEIGYIIQTVNEVVGI